MTHEFTPDWPHGHVAGVDDLEYPARVIAADAKLTKGRTVIALVNRLGADEVHAFLPDGTAIFGDARFIRNAPAPKARGTDWIVRWKDRHRRRSAWFADTEDDARRFAKDSLSRIPSAKDIAIVRVDWEEGEGLGGEG